MSNDNRLECSIVMGGFLIMFVILKVFGIIECSWLWILSPLWILPCAIIGAVVFMGIFFVVLGVVMVIIDEVL